MFSKRLRLGAFGLSLGRQTQSSLCQRTLRFPRWGTPRPVTWADRAEIPFAWYPEGRYYCVFLSQMAEWALVARSHRCSPLDD